jgi:enoyl-CoA hydratase
MSSNEHVRVEPAGAVGSVVLDRAEKRNALSMAMVAAVADGVRALEALDHVELIVLRSEGPAFSSGGDLKEKGEVALSHQDAWGVLAAGQDLVNSIEQCTKVVVARVQGAAHAGGLLLSLAADMTVAARSARFRIPELLRGRPDPFIPPRLVAKVGRERAGFLMFTAAEITADDAERYGLVARVVDDDQLDAALAEVVAAVLATDRSSRMAWKQLLRRLDHQVDPWELTTSFTRHETAMRSNRFDQKD